MEELRAELKTVIEGKLASYLQHYGFSYHPSILQGTGSHDIFDFKREDQSYLYIHHYGFYFSDYPWSIIPMLGLNGFKASSKQFDAVSLLYWKQKIAPSQRWQRDALNLTFDNYPVNSVEQITKSADQVIIDLDNFCKDFLKRDYLRFNKIRQINYLEYLTQIQVYGEYHRDGKKDFTFYYNKEVE